MATQFCSGPRARSVLAVEVFDDRLTLVDRDSRVSARRRAVEQHLDTGLASAYARVRREPKCFRRPDQPVGRTIDARISRRLLNHRQIAAEGMAQLAQRSDEPRVVRVVVKCAANLVDEHGQNAFSDEHTRRQPVQHTRFSTPPSDAARGGA